MDTPILGIHHVTAMVADPQQNIDFYTGVLGLRLVKQTVNFDDPYTYHLYYGDELGRPGTIVTFFPWVGIRPGSRGTGLVSALAFAVPAAALDYWAARLADHGVRASEPELRFGAQVLSFYDPAGLLLEIVAQPGVEDCPAWQGGPVPAEYALRGLAGVTLTLQTATPTATLLTERLGFRHSATAGNRTRYLISDGTTETAVDILARPDVPFGIMGSGSVHHIAWRVADAAGQLAWREHLTRHGLEVTPVRDRQYFHSIYFREPGGTLFEIATDTPGFAIDETPEQLGTMLKLPPWLESQRTAIQERLPALTLPTLAPKGV